MTRTHPAIAAAATLWLAACAHQTAVPPALADARASVRAAETDPNVAAHAALELKKATDTLDRANAMLAKNDKYDDIASVAYVADQQARAAVAIGQAKRQEASIKEAEAERERARADVRAAEAARALAQASAADQRASAARMQAAAAEATASAAVEQNARLRQQIVDLQARQTDRGMLVTLGDVLFEFDRADIKPAAHASIQKLADFLQKHPERRVLIEGHTDNIGSEGYNEMLSLRRAEAVATALERLGVASGRVATTGYGKDFPVASNTTDTNRALNRRVEVYISDNDQPVRLRG